MIFKTSSSITVVFFSYRSIRLIRGDGPSVFMGNCGKRGLGETFMMIILIVLVMKF